MRIFFRQSKMNSYGLGASCLRRILGFFFLLIDSCPDRKYDDEDDKGSDKYSKDDQQDFPSRSSGSIYSFYGICSSDHFDIIILARIADDSIVSKYLTHIRHDDICHICRIDLI